MNGFMCSQCMPQLSRPKRKIVKSSCDTYRTLPVHACTQRQPRYRFQEEIVKGIVRGVAFLSLKSARIKLGSQKATQQAKICISKPERVEPPKFVDNRNLVFDMRLRSALSPRHLQKLSIKRVAIDHISVYSMIQMQKVDKLQSLMSYSLPKPLQLFVQIVNCYRA